MCVASRNGLTITQTYFEKITVNSGGNKSEIDWLMMKRTQKWCIKDFTVIAGKHVTTQHKPLVWVLRFAASRDGREMDGK